MKKITALSLLRLGFKKVDVLPEDNDGEEGFYYFVFDLESKTGYPILITTDDDNKNDSYSVEINELEDNIIIKDLKDLKALVGIIRRNINNEWESIKTPFGKSNYI